MLDVPEDMRRGSSAQTLLLRNEDMMRQSILGNTVISISRIDNTTVEALDIREPTILKPLHRLLRVGRLATLGKEKGGSAQALSLANLPMSREASPDQSPKEARVTGQAGCESCNRELHQLV